MKEMYRQGDVALVKITKLPKKLVEKDKVLALGETTGHKHQFVSQSVQVFRDNKNNQFVDVKQDSELVHEEHHKLQIPKGKYKVVLQREFDLVSGTRQVLD